MLIGKWSLILDLIKSFSGLFLRCFYFMIVNTPFLIGNKLCPFFRSHLIICSCWLNIIFNNFISIFYFLSMWGKKLGNWSSSFIILKIYHSFIVIEFITSFLKYIIIILLVILILDLVSIYCIEKFISSLKIIFTFLKLFFSWI